MSSKRILCQFITSTASQNTPLSHGTRAHPLTD